MKYFYLAILLVAVLSPAFGQFDGPIIVRDGACMGYTLEVNSVAYDNGTAISNILCWDTNGNGVGDPAEDTNSDGVFNVFDCAGGPGCWDLNGNGALDASEDVDGDGVASIFDCPTCWDTNFNGIEDPDEDANGDGVWDAFDCPPIGSGICEAVPMQDVTISASNTLNILDDGDFLNGVSTLDLVQITRWLFEGFPSALETITSDWDGDGTVSTSDLIEMRRMILGVDVTNSYNNYFVVPAGFTFPDVDPFDMNVDYTSMTFADTDIVDNKLSVFVFRAGDVNESASLVGDDEVTGRARKEIIYQDQFMTAGETVSVPFSMRNDDSILGSTFKLASDDLEFGDLVAESDQSNYLSHKDENILAISYINITKATELSFTVDITASRDGYLREFLSLDDALVPELVDGNEAEHGLVLIAGSVSSTEELEDGQVLLFPNPMTDVLQLQFEEAKDRTVTLINASGQVVSRAQVTDQTYKMNRSADMISGLYLLRVDTDTQSQSFRVVIK